MVAARSIDQVDEVAAEIAAAGGEALSVTCDVAVSMSIEAAVGRARVHFGPVDVLVNNAGFAEGAPLVRLDEALWARTLATNRTGNFLCTRAVLPAMIERRRGRIINSASIAARKGLAYTAAYCASKHRVLGFTRAPAVEVARAGITVNAICPGWVDTDMTTASI